MGCNSSTAVTKKVVFLGLDGSGKTRIISRLRFGLPATKFSDALNIDVISTYPVSLSDDFKLDELKDLKKGKQLQNELALYDMNGGEIFRPFWKILLNEANTVVFVIDSTDKERLPTVKAEIEKIDNDQSIRPDLDILFLANKQDLGNALAPIQIEDELKLYKLRHKYRILGTSAIDNNARSKRFMQLYGEFEMKCDPNEPKEQDELSEFIVSWVGLDSWGSGLQEAIEYLANSPQ